MNGGPEMHGRFLDQCIIVATVFAVVEPDNMSLGNHRRSLIADTASREGRVR